MEQLALLNVIRMDMMYRFRLDLPDGPATDPPECITELTAELNERLRRALLSTSQYIQTLETKAQVRRGGAVDSLFSLGRLLFDSLLPAPIQEALHPLDFISRQSYRGMFAGRRRGCHSLYDYARSNSAYYFISSAGQSVRDAYAY